MKTQTCFKRAKIKSILLLLCLFAFLSGCPTVQYTKGGATQADFNRDKQYCEGVAEREYVRNGTRKCDEIDRCLASRGWRGEQKKGFSLF